MRILPVICAITLFFTAFLSFSVQPMLGKMLLPMVGGAPAGWIVAMAFFQIALLGGYGISLLLSRFSPWVHALVLAGLYGAGFVFLPPVALPADLPAITGGQSGGVATSLAVVLVLARTVLVPFLALTATTSALQRVFAATREPDAKDPYYLFVASNAGSFAGLFFYPFVLEPWLGLGDQARLWTLVYGAAVILLVASCLRAWFRRETDAMQPVLDAGTFARTEISAKQMVLWLVLAFVPCSLSMGVTTLITTDMAGIPLLWVLPLGLYLLTFMLAFARRPLFSLQKASRWQINATGCLLLIMVIGPLWGLGFKPSGNMLLYAAFSLFLMEVFFASALACHMRLAALRPPVDRLALYYFILALGGSLAGAVHAFVLPFVLPDVFEFPVMMLLALLLVPAAVTGARKIALQRFMPVLALLAATGAAVALSLKPERDDPVLGAALVTFVIPFLLVSGQRRWLFAVGVVIVMLTFWHRYDGEVRLTDRNFFGARAVYDKTDEHGRTIRYFVHGITLHGLEVLSPHDPQLRYAATYYARGNPISEVLALHPVREWAVIGLGVGQSACYDPALVTDFYEIDPDVEDVARRYFTYLQECPPRDVIIGDGLLELVRKGRRYGVLLLDAFSSDGIPVHLLTENAMRHYQAGLHKDGVALFHVSNRFLDLSPFVAAAAETIGKTAYRRDYNPDRKAAPLDEASRWVAVPMNPADGIRLEAEGWKPVAPAARAWTDDRSSLLDAVKLVP